MTGDRLEVALEEADAAFRRGDALAAAAAIDAAAAECEALACAGAALPGDALRRMRALQAGVLDAATRTRDALAAELESAGAARRAVRAYDGR